MRYNLQALYFLYMANDSTNWNLIAKKHNAMLKQCLFMQTTKYCLSCITLYRVDADTCCLYRYC